MQLKFSPHPACFGRSATGAVLLEAVLGLLLLMVTVGLISGAMHRSLLAVDRMWAQLTAEDLAVSILSEVQAGIRPRTAQGPESFDEPWAEWTWQVQIESVEGDPEIADQLEQIVVRVMRQDEAVGFELRQMVWQTAANGLGGPAW